LFRNRHGFRSLGKFRTPRLVEESCKEGVMNSSRNRLVSVLFGVLLIVGGGVGLLLAVSRTARLPGTPVAAPLPDVAVSTLGGEVVNLADLRGRPVLINFWATWCPPCREEMPALERIERKWAERDAAVIVINFEEDEATIQRYLAENGLSLPVFQDSSGEAAQKLDITYLPTTLFVDSAGVIRSRNEGSLSQGQMEAGLRVLQQYK
jgi:thiol-disulfide isomerase/thioredoxin